MEGEGPKNESLFSVRTLSETPCRVQIKFINEYHFSRPTNGESDFISAGFRSSVVETSGIRYFIINRGGSRAVYLSSDDEFVIRRDDARRSPKAELLV